MEWSYFVNRVAGDTPALVDRMSCRIVWIREEKLEVQGAQLIRLPYMERHVFSRDFIFVGFVSDLPEDPVKAPHDCVCVADVPLPETYTPEIVPGNLLVLESCEKTSDLSLLLNHINFVLADDFRYYRGLERIERLRQRGGLHEAVRLVERLVTNPALLLDSQGRFLSSGGCYTFVNTWLREAEQNGGLNPAQLREIRDSSVYLALRDDYYRYAETYAWAMHRFLCVPVRVRGLEIAQLVIELAFSAFHLSSIQLLEPVTQLLAEIINQRMEDGNDRSILHSLLFIELLRATPEQMPGLRRRIEEMNWREERGMRLLCCGSTTGDGEAGEAAFAQLRQRYSGARWTSVENHWLLLLYPDSGPVPDIQVLEQLELSVGCSWTFDSLDRLPYAWVEAQRALLRGKGRLTEYAEVFAAHICTLPAEIAQEHLHPAVHRLAQYDRSHDGNLLDTLEAYLSGPEQPAEAAARLYISRSTLFYRINRIRELCGVELTTGEERMNLLLSLRLLRALKEQ